MGPANILIILHIRTVWSESSLGAFWIAKDAKFLYADNEDWSDCTDAQTDFSLRWTHMSEGTFPYVAANFVHLFIFLGLYPTTNWYLTLT